MIRLMTTSPVLTLTWNPSFPGKDPTTILRRWNILAAGACLNEFGSDNERYWVPKQASRILTVQRIQKRSFGAWQNNLAEIAQANTIPQTFRKKNDDSLASHSYASRFGCSSAFVDIRSSINRLGHHSDTRKGWRVVSYKLRMQRGC